MRRMAWARRALFLALITAPMWGGNRSAVAQDGGGTAPAGATIHIVQRGENLFRIAIRYGTTVEAIAAANGIKDPAAIAVGQRLLIPNAAPGTPGVPVEYTAGPGDSLVSLAARFGTTIRAAARDNRIVQPDALYIGQPVYLQEGAASGDRGITRGWMHMVAPGELVYRIALRYSVTVDSIVRANHLIGEPPRLYSGQRLVIPGDENAPALVDMPAPFTGASALPAPAEQGRSVALRYWTAVPATLQGEFMGRPVTFVSDNSRTLHGAILGIDALATPGLYRLQVTATDDQGGTTFFSRNLAVQDGGYASETIRLLAGQEDLLNPAVTEPETARIAALVAQFTPMRYFGGLLGLPCPAPVTSQYGTRRAYNDGPFDRIHTGVDFAAMPGAAIYAPAAGVVVLAETLNVRGNATVIDHGWGVYTGYWHQTEIKVQVGQVVQQGQIIGTVGQTGRVTGPHLHWELFVNGVQVDPLQWTRQSFP